MFNAHRLASRWMKIAIPYQLSRSQSATVHHYCALLKRFCQIRDRALRNLTAQRLKFLHQVVEENARINHGSVENIAIWIFRWQLFFVSVAEALHGCHPPGVCARDGFKLQKGWHKNAPPPEMALAVKLLEGNFPPGRDFIDGIG